MSNNGSYSSKKLKRKAQQKQTTGMTILMELVSWIFTIGLAIVLALVIKNYIIINANVPSGSMERTIMTGDRLFGNRLAYLFSEPDRGDIVIFLFPDNENEKYVKRVIGLPGETVRIKDAKIYINDNPEPLNEPYLSEEWVVDNDGYVFQVPEGAYLVLGDNRNNSWDARCWTNTYVYEDKILGQAGLRYYPFNKIGMID